jgi:hypothetical protein
MKHYGVLKRAILTLLFRIMYYVALLRTMQCVCDIVQIYLLFKEQNVKFFTTFSAD